MRKFFLITALLQIAIFSMAHAQNSKNLFTLKGVVTDAVTGKPIEMVNMTIPEYSLWGTTNYQGEFEIQRVPAGAVKIALSRLGYKYLEVTVDVTEKTFDKLSFKLEEENLKLETVTVTAKDNKSSMNTSRVINRQAIDHIQLINATDIMSLMPGGKTVNPNLMLDTKFSIRGTNTNSSFDTGVMIDGIKLSANTDLTGSVSGPGARNLGMANIESIEVISGVPSVEYGDILNGMVIINTKKGKSPLSAAVTLNPNTKSVSLSKGIELGENAGILNLSGEYAHAYSNPVSRYTTYFRNAYNANYSKTVSLAGSPLSLNISAGGSYGMQNTDKDPDLYSKDWSKAHDNSARFGASGKWLINNKWITSLNAEVSASYTDSYSASSTLTNKANIMPSVNATESGYFATNLQPTSYDNYPIHDSKGLSFNAGIKGTLNKRIYNINNNILAGISWSSTGNVGKGDYFGNDVFTTGYRPRPFTDIPFFNNFSAYLSDNVTVPIGSTSLSMMAGVRLESVYIKDMAYNKPTTFSPRFNVKYTILDENSRQDEILRGVSVRGGLGMMEKLPSLGVLYPATVYQDVEVFAKNYGTDNKYFYAAKTKAYKDFFNPDLRWSRSRNSELSLDVNIAGIRLSVTYFNNKNKNPYTQQTTMTPYPIRISDGADPNIPVNPQFRVDQQTGFIYYKDLDNPNMAERQVRLLVEDTVFRAERMQINGEPTVNEGIEFAVDFGRIRAIRTSFRLDGNYNFRTNYNTLITPTNFNSISHTSLPNRSYQYIAYYFGGTSRSITSNGTKTRDMNANFTATTHIPEIRMTISLRLEATIFNRSQNLTSVPKGLKSLYGNEWAYLTDADRNRLEGSVYGKEHYTGVWPVAYAGIDGVVHPFTAESAKNPELAYMIGTSNTVYTFVKDGYNAYFMGNVAITKELGDHVSLSFYVNNFTKSNPFVRNIAQGTYSTRNIDFGYGATIRIKL